MRQQVEFISKGSLCRGWLYVPEKVAKQGTAPGIVMAHGFAGLKEMGLAGFAECFEAAGFVTLVFDYRFWGESEGEPRNQIFALEMVDDYRNAITWLSMRPEVDPDCIGRRTRNFGSLRRARQKRQLRILSGATGKP